MSVYVDTKNLRTNHHRIDTGTGNVPGANARLEVVAVTAGEEPKKEQAAKEKEEKKRKEAVQDAVQDLMEQTGRNKRVCTGVLKMHMMPWMSVLEAYIVANQMLTGDAGTGSISGANSGLGESATGAAEEPEDEPEDPAFEVLRKRESKIWKMIGKVCDEGLKLADGTEKDETKATLEALIEVTKKLEVQIKSHLKKRKLETKMLKAQIKSRLKKKKLEKERWMELELIEKERWMEVHGVD